MRKIEHFPDFDVKSFGLLRTLLPSAERVDMALAVFTLRNWLDVEARLQAFTANGGRLHVLIWSGAVSVEGLVGLCRLTAVRKVARMACTHAVGDMALAYTQGATLYGYLH